MSKKIALIDGYGFVFRAYHAMPPLSRADGTPVGAVYGFTNMLIKLLASLDVSHIAVVFDAGSKTFRNDIFPQYKANRPPCPEDLKPQFPLVRQAAESLNITILEKTGVEADDIIATIAKKYAATDHEVIIVSSDKDLMQLINDHVVMYDAMKNKEIRENEVKEKFFVTPNKVLDVLSLIGDSSDNIPGVKGIGPKTAAELILQYGDLENLLSHLDEIKQEKRRQMLIDGAENARISRVLAALKEDVDLGISLTDLEIKNIDPHKLLAFLEEQGFKSLVARISKEFGVTSSSTASPAIHQQHKKEILKESENKIPFESIKKTEIISEEIFSKIFDEAFKNGLVTIDLNDDDFFTISTAKRNCDAKEIFFCELKSEKESAGDLFSFEPENKANHDFIWQGLEKILNENSIRKIFFDGKNFLRHILQNQNLRIGDVSFDDLSLLNCLVNPTTNQALLQLIEINLGENGFGEFFVAEEKNQKINFENSDKKIDFFAFKNFAIYQLYQIFYPKIFEQKLNEAYFSYELPLLQIIAQIEVNGIEIDVTKLRNLSQEFATQIAKLSAEIYALAGEEFNIASTQQLSKILFEKLNLDSDKKSKKTGALSTSSSVLEALEEEGHEIARKILDFRKFSKLKNTYTDALPKEINPKTNRIHTTFSSISTSTGRLSSSNPNLQNIPIRTAEGKKIREAFIAKKDHLLISADYSQIELRVIAHVAKITNLITAFKENKDIHRITASQIFGIHESEVSDDLRSKAKAINFGIIYGISGFGLARQLGISRQDAKNYIDSYLKTYPGIDAYMKEYIAIAHQQGFVQTISGRKCFIREINNKNPMIRNEAERFAINAPIQGSAADIIKIAMIRLDKKIKKENLEAKIILQIHDELIIETPENEAEKIAQIVKKEMENAILLDAPLKVDVEIGKSWR